jgi:hypothetical protein
VDDEGNFMAENERLKRQREYRTCGDGMSLRATYFGKSEQDEKDEPFAILHRNF